MQNITVSEVGDTAIITIIGDLVFQNAKTADEIFKTVVDKKPKTIGLDCKNLSLLDSSGLGAFIRIAIEAKKQNIALVIIDIQKRIATLLNMSKLTKMFEFLDREQFEEKYIKI
ncbi:MAG: STAS domain-containing protein [bacterium]|nr:STAS domain-containing protein [bacterium]